MSIRYTLMLCMCVILLLIMLWHICGFLRAVRRHKVTQVQRRQEYVWLIISGVLVVVPCVMVIVSRLYH